MSNEIDNQIDDRRLPIDLKREFIIAKCDYYSNIGIWPLKSLLNPELWLTNFNESEMDHALYLLNAFTYFPSVMVDEIFSAGIRRLSRINCDNDDDCLSLVDKWNTFLDSSIVTYVTGETPNPADSGHIYTRKIRALGISEHKIRTPEEACLDLQKGIVKSVIFVDDFVGSGNQFLETWRRPYGCGFTTLCKTSFSKIASKAKAKIYYCPAFCTEIGLKRIQKKCPQVIVNPGHIIPNSYNMLDPSCIMWPPELKPTALSFLKTASLRAGIPDTKGRQPNDWRGFAQLGLTIAFGDSVPDATLPIFYWENNGWHPLIRKA